MAQGDSGSVLGISPKYFEIRTLFRARAGHRYVQHRELIKTQGGEFAISNTSSAHESFAKRFVSIIGKEQRGEIEPSDFLF